MTTLDSIQILTNHWNNYFDADIKIDKNLNTEDVSCLFDDYLKTLNLGIKFEYSENICFINNTNTCYTVLYSENNNIKTKTYDIKSRKRLYSFLSNFLYIITEGFALDAAAIPLANILRAEIIVNLYTSNHTHFFDKNLPFSEKDNRIFISEIFMKNLIDSDEKLNIIKYNSYIFNEFERGLMIDGVCIKPTITISTYGRWYWSNTEKIQNNIKARNNIYNKLLKYGNIINIDLISGEPAVLGELSGSKTLKALIKNRITLNKNNNIDYSNVIKNIINIFIHSLDSPKAAYSRFKHNNKNYEEVERILETSVLDIFTCLQNDFLCYNNNVLHEYNKNLAIVENFRRIVNPKSAILNKKELLKEHRKFLQGLVHDKILNISMDVFNSIKINPIFTIHDSASYYINDDSIIDNIVNEFKRVSIKHKTPITIEILEKKKSKGDN